MKLLTKHAHGSVRELWTIAWPLVLSAAANMFMLLGDRIVLSRYSTEAFNANVGALPWVWTAYFPLFSIVFIANVFVGRHNGAGDFKKIGPTVWQMLWFSLALLVPLLPLSYFLAPHLLAHDLRGLGVPYLRILLPSVPISLASFGALAAFFTGRGETRLVSAVSLFCNVLNFALDTLLVFGIGPFPEMGICGAAWGTVIAQLIALCLFGFFFLDRRHREKYGVNDCRFNGRIFWQCFRVGGPNAFSATINFILWSWIVQVMAHYVSSENFTAFGVSNTLFYFLLFFVEGVSLATGTIASNAYGAGAWEVIGRNARSWLKLSISFSIFAFFVMVIYPRPLLFFFVDGPMTDGFRSNLKTMLFLTWLAIANTGIEFNQRQTLTAFGDTLFTMGASLFGYAGMVIIPGFIALRMTHNGASFLVVEAISQIFFIITFYLRYRFHWMRHRSPSP
ncbi:MAG: polysaccharide biosynthesis C-terminal domain-containing protein [Puniceicoccales bacterium]|jgi:MATE family multidrug resistance protein|nr:polysaccharide biosynthesis C-terminal domain-containing protein [Puniceicoccales bacterium]